MDLGLTDKVFVVGGGSSGLGHAVARALVEERARVLLVSRDEMKLEAACAELGDGTTACAADISSASGVDSVVQAAESLGGLDGLLVNAGGPPAGNALDLTDEQWDGAFRLLLGGPLRLIRGLLPIMREGASILFITSSSVRVPIPGLDTSNVFRPGVAALAKCLALQLGPRVRVNSLAPGRLDTERVRSLDESRAAAERISVEDQRDRMRQAIALGRYGDPIELGRVAAFLLSPAASYVSGGSIQVDGGYVRAIP